MGIVSFKIDKILKFFGVVRFWEEFVFFYSWFVRIGLVVCLRLVSFFFFRSFVVFRFLGKFFLRIFVGVIVFIFIVLYMYFLIFLYVVVIVLILSGKLNMIWILV